MTTKELDSMTVRQREFCLEIAALANVLGVARGLTVGEVRELLIKVAHNDPIWVAFTAMNPRALSAIDDLIPDTTALVEATPERRRD